MSYNYKLYGTTVLTHLNTIALLKVKQIMCDDVFITVKKERNIYEYILHRRQAVKKVICVRI